MAGIWGDVQAYLNQGLPSIDPIFGPYTPSPDPWEPTTPAPVPSPGLTPEQLLLLQQQQGTPGGGRDDAFTGFGRFDNLDEDSMKMQEIAVMNKDGTWDLQTVPTYRHSTTGHFQTFEGKNVNHFGAYPPTLAALFSGQWTGKPTTGSIASMKKLKELQPIIRDYHKSKEYGLGDGSVMENEIRKARHKKHSEFQAEIAKSRHGDHSVGSGSGKSTGSSMGKGKSPSDSPGTPFNRGGLAQLWPR